MEREKDGVVKINCILLTSHLAGHRGPVVMRHVLDREVGGSNLGEGKNLYNKEYLHVY